MGLRCLLGHDFSEPRTERDREERGDEVVITISEVKECRRCGETRVVSENKEVTSVDQLLEESGSAAADTGPDSDGGHMGSTAETAGATKPSDPAEPEPDDAVDAADTGPPDDAEAAAVRDDGDQAADDPDAVEADFDHPAADPADDGGDPDVREDAEILDADEDGDGDASTGGAGADDAEPTAGTGTPDSGGRAHGEWPDADTNRRDDDADGGHAEWPDADRNVSDQPSDEAEADGQHRPADGESADVEFIDGADAADENAAANEARTDVVPDAKRADEPGAATDPSEEDAEFVDGDGPGDWPEQAGDDEGYDAELGDDGDDDGVSVDGNLSPQVDPAVADREDVEFIEADADAAADGRARTAEHDGSDGVGEGDQADADRPRPNVGLRTTADRVDTVYACPECGNSEPVGASSMRAGDICPECKRDYIQEREVR